MNVFVFRYQSDGSQTSNCNTNSHKSLWLGEIGTLDVDCHYNPLEVNSSYLQVQYRENKTIKFTFTLLKTGYINIPKLFLRLNGIGIIKAPRLIQDS